MPPAGCRSRWRSTFRRTDTSSGTKHFNAVDRLIKCSILHLLVARLRRDGRVQSSQRFLWACLILSVLIFLDLIASVLVLPMQRAAHVVRTVCCLLSFTACFAIRLYIKIVWASFVWFVLHSVSRRMPSAHCRIRIVSMMLLSLHRIAFPGCALAHSVDAKSLAVVS